MSVSDECECEFEFEFEFECEFELACPPYHALGVRRREFVFVLEFVLAFVK